jgi:ABC-type sugar transport system ATPase subunit
MKDSERLVIEDIHKTMGAVRALVDVSLTVSPGTVHGIIGHNGSGKSTLIKILAGVMPPDQGSYQIVDSDGPNGQQGRSPRVAAVFQDLGLADDLSVLDNLLVNSFRRGKLGLISMADARSRAQAAMAAVGIDLPIKTEVRKLPEAERVMLCVARAMMRAGVSLEDGAASLGRAGSTSSPGHQEVNADLLVMDEPTSSLPRKELERFRDLVRRLKDETGVTMLVVTHNPTDITAFCDEFTALKDGQVLCTQEAAGVTASMLAELMSGQSAMVEEAEKGERAKNEAAVAAERNRLGRRQMFVADQVMAPNLSGPVSLSAAEGELVGLTGLEGSGFREFIRAALGVGEIESGRVTIGGQQLHGGPAALQRAGALFIPSDRARTSGVPAATIYENMTLGRVDAYCRNGVINTRHERSAVTGMLERLRVSPADPRRLLSQLSGGQQQKVVVGRALLSSAKFLVFEEPTAAVDVGAREAILRDLQQVAQDGCAVIVASGEFEWMSAVCDRIVVFQSGRIAGELLPAQMGEAAILRLAYGD